MKLNKISPNPNNPRVIKDDRFEALCKSIKEFPKMMSLRPIVVDQDLVVLGGNMRLKALQHLGFDEIPDEWIKYAKDMTEQEIQRFIIADNVGFGQWNWDELANEWEIDELEDWGLNVYGLTDITPDDLYDDDDSSDKETVTITFKFDQATHAAIVDKLAAVDSNKETALTKLLKV